MYVHAQFVFALFKYNALFVNKNNDGTYFFDIFG